MTVRVKTLNFNTTTPLITYRSSSTSTPPSAPASCPSSSSPICFSSCLLLWKFKKNWKEVGDNMHHKHVVLWFGTEITSLHRGQQRLCTWQWTKIKIQWQLIWPYSCLKEMEHMKYLRKRPFGISFVLIVKARHFENWKKAKNLKFVMTH